MSLVLCVVGKVYYRLEGEHRQRQASGRVPSERGPELGHVRGRGERRGATDQEEQPGPRDWLAKMIELYRGHRSSGEGMPSSRPCRSMWQPSSTLIC